MTWMVILKCTNRLDPQRYKIVNVEVLPVITGIVISLCVCVCVCEEWGRERDTTIY